ncbi:MAG: ADP-forming succinate--CoA ligase subunit beta [Candidatus Thermoplasmatota archaeon]|nr:ADP-forming succinate--CoA ligase subunit beta [Candidatus Thermoplasmatota archaeon]
MNLYEYMGKEIFSSFGIPVPSGYVIHDVADLKPLSGSVVVKSQVLIGGRGKSGGIKFASDEAQLKEAVTGLLGTKIRGYTVSTLLIEEKINIAKEYYVSISLNRTERKPLIMASASGGVEIESVDPKEIYTRIIDPLTGYSDYIGREIVSFLGLQGEVASQFRSLLSKLYKVFKEEDCELAEINPLVLTAEGKVLAADAKVVIDSDSLYRHQKYNVTDPEKTPLELEAQGKGYSFVEMDGLIGVIANGAGLTMATLDALTLHKGNPRNFLDLGGTDSIDIVVNAFELVLKANPKAILVNIFGGVTKCDTVASGITAAKAKFNISRPIVVRLSGVREEEGREILKNNGIQAYSEMMPAIEAVVKAAGGA